MHVVARIGIMETSDEVHDTHSCLGSEDESEILDKAAQDIMDIVMKRRVGGSSNEDSPAKKRKPACDSETDQTLGTGEGRNGTGTVGTRMDIEVQNEFSDSSDVHRNSLKNDGSKVPIKQESEGSNKEYSISGNYYASQCLKQTELKQKLSVSEESSTPDLDKRSEANTTHSSTSFGTYKYRSEPSSRTLKNESPCISSEHDANKTTDYSELKHKIQRSVYKFQKEENRIIKSDDAKAENIDETDGDVCSFSHEYSQEKSVKDDETRSPFFHLHPEHGSKKSRKQVMPKRKMKSSTDQGLTVERYRSENGAKPETKGLAVENIESASNQVSPHLAEKELIGSDLHINTHKEKGHESHEKSRKQNAPKKIVDNMFVVKHTNREAAIPEDQLANKVLGDKEKNNRNLDSLEDNAEKSRKQCVPGKIFLETSLIDQNDEDTKRDYGKEGIEKAAFHPRDDSLDSLFSDNTNDSTQGSKPDDLNNFPSSSISKFNLDISDSYLSPELQRLSQQIAQQADLLAKLSRSRIQMTETLGKGKEHSLSDNLAFVRKLREIRFNRYRKISISEKKHIASFAKLHGISAAANYFGVSKSAVSLWTRTDFKETDEDLARKKRNCLIGNEKFESLVERVRQEKATKFKNLSKEDKIDVVKYAKLVGVREMSRCMDIALGTVSGWMRQFPYAIQKKTEENQGEESNSQDTSNVSFKIESDNDIQYKTKIHLQAQERMGPECKSSIKQEMNDLVYQTAEIKKIDHGAADGKDVQDKYLSLQKVEESNAGNEKITIKQEPFTEGCPVSLKNPFDNENTHKKGKDELLSTTDDSEYMKIKQSMYKSVLRGGSLEGNSCLEIVSEENGCVVKKSNNNTVLDIKGVNIRQKPTLDPETDLENIIADSLVKPDVNQCFEEVKEQIAGTVLDGDEYFEHLFKRVTETRVEKYKTLKASEKLEVVRYAKRIGVRRIAKIMDLATGTLSGWIIKYQHLLGLVSDSSMEIGSNSLNLSSEELDQSQNSGVDSEAEASQISENPELISDCSCNSSPHTSSRASSILDSVEKTEVTALKFLLKERYPVLLETIDTARRFKFKTLAPAEKIEIVKCAKLVGIRPTARVFQMPLGTLSGWISKYSDFLEPEFQGEGCSSWSENSLSNSLDTLNKPDLSANAPLNIAPHLQWTAHTASRENETPESPYSKMMNEMAEKSFSNFHNLAEKSLTDVQNVCSSAYDMDELKGKTNILNRRLSVEWPKMDSNDDSNSQSEMSWPKVKLPNGPKESIKVPNLDMGFSKVLHGHNNDFHSDAAVKAMAQQYLQQFGMVRFAHPT